MSWIINRDAVEFEARPAAFSPKGETANRFDAQLGQVSARVGAQQLGYNITRLPPGKRAFPFHNHRVNEELFYVLTGNGEVRMGAETYPIREGDFIACPSGGPEMAHQIINTGETALEYLAVSTRLYPEVCDYPDSGKIGILAQFTNAETGEPERFAHITRLEHNLDYWEGE